MIEKKTEPCIERFKQGCLFFQPHYSYYYGVTNSPCHLVSLCQRGIKLLNEQLFNICIKGSTDLIASLGKFVCVKVLRPSHPNGVMSNAISLPKYTLMPLHMLPYKRRVAEFKRGRVSIEDDPCSGRPVTVASPEIVTSP